MEVSIIVSPDQCDKDILPTITPPLSESYTMVIKTNLQDGVTKGKIPGKVVYEISQLVLVLEACVLREEDSMKWSVKSFKSLATMTNDV